MAQRRTLARHGFEVPVNGAAEGEAAQAEQVEAPFRDAARALNHRRSGGRAPPAAQLPASLALISEGGEELRLGARAEV